MNPIRALILFLFVVAQISGYGQDKASILSSIDNFVSQTEKIKSKSDYFSLSFDTVSVTGELTRKKISARCFFTTSNTVLTISLYSKDSELLYARVEEQSPALPDLYRHSMFYFNNGKIFKEDYSHAIRACMMISPDKSIHEVYGYNPALEGVFLKSFILKLYEKTEALKLSSNMVLNERL